jgi:hypothetical protein
MVVGLSSGASDSRLYRYSRSEVNPSSELDCDPEESSEIDEGHEEEHDGEVLTEIVYVDRVSTVEKIVPAVVTEIVDGDPVFVHSTRSAAKDFLRGRPGESDLFSLSARPGFGPKRSDVIIGSVEDGDRIEIYKSAFGLDFDDREPSFVVALSLDELKDYQSSDFDVVYFERRGEFFLNRNGSRDGWGRDGGLFLTVKSQDPPILAASQVSFI